MFNMLLSTPVKPIGIIAKWYTGDFNKWSAIAKANPAINPNRISIGDEIKIPYEVVTNDSPMPKSAVRRASSSKKSAPKASKSSSQAKEFKPEMKSEPVVEKEVPKEAPVVAEREIITEPKGDSVEDEFDAMLEEASKKEQESEQVKEEETEKAEDSGRDKLLEELLSE